MRRQGPLRPPGPIGPSWPPKPGGPPGSTSGSTTQRPLWPPSGPGAPKPPVGPGPRMQQASPGVARRSPWLPSPSRSPLRSEGSPSPAILPRPGLAANQSPRVDASRFRTNQQNPWAKAPTPGSSQSSPNKGAKGAFQQPASASASKPKLKPSPSSGPLATAKQHFRGESRPPKAKAVELHKSKRPKTVPKQIIVAKQTSRSTSIQSIPRSRWCPCR